MFFPSKKVSADTNESVEHRCGGVFTHQKEEIKEKRSFIYLFLSFLSSSQGSRLITLIRTSFTMWIMFPNNAGLLLLTYMMQMSVLPLAELTISQFWWLYSQRGNAEHLNILCWYKMSEKNGHLETSTQTLTLNKQTPPWSAYFWDLFWVSFHMLLVQRPAGRDLGSTCGGKWVSQMCHISVTALLPDEVATIGKNKITLCNQTVCDLE